MVSALTESRGRNGKSRRQLAREEGRGVRLSGNGPHLRRRNVPYLLLLPAGILLAFFSILPFFWALLISVQPPLQASSGSITTVSWANFRDVLTDPETWNGLVVTLIYAALSTLLIIAFSIGSALALKTVQRGTGFYQVFLLIPLTLAPPVVIILWRALFDPSGGLFDGILLGLGLPQQGFYESSSQALLVLVAMAVWSNVGFWTLVFLSSLRAMSSELWEAAEIDGAGAVRAFISITLPLLKRTVLLASVVLSTAGLVVFIPAQLLTQGGPGGSTNFLMYMAAQDVLRFGQPGNANAIVVVILALIAIVATVQFRLIRSDDA
jgi:multiple sugar transport system permease protein